MSFRLLLACLFTTFASPVFAEKTAPTPWVVATYAYPERDRIAAIQPLADYLAKRGRHPVQVKLFPSPTALVQAMREGQVDVAVPNLHGYLQARRDIAQVTTLPVPQVPALQADRYRAVLVARDVASFAEVKAEAGRLRLALVGGDSASGGFVPARYLRSQTLDPAKAFASVTYSGSHAAALQAVVEGRADVAALAGDVYDASRPDGVRELWRSDPIPPGPLLCRATTDVPCQAMAAWLLDAHREDPAVMTDLRVGWPEFGDATMFAPADAAELSEVALTQD
ncbi:phosphate/phosphite/phosphonate ABC transporter binding protein [Pseudoxanthomonas japonensis]|uniref:phosphate/phosphite/phosphonate ABC transporter substrate-binding protein n=1 Tax=Pseudoxanthomonas japonensis TaxID=69284 RepID=UPI00285D441B|nr:PhnD/SsuA/transferrin family substrate-binding protein [Pseudoxanthomonas japonensis]MDR7068196.1 phosphate/phosphite/phosphonate ABC transporter binding protein [Pseudoxanthomonas japonensis]